MAKNKEDNNIKIRGARVNNLKNISLDIPREKFVVITGVSGSGKSSLAFDTLFAEGQRRFAESISSFARQFLGRIQKPAVDDISGIPPAIAIEQKVNTRNPRSTVGSVTEIYDYLRLLYARIGKTYSPISGELAKNDTTEDVIKYIASFGEEHTFFILSPIGWRDDQYRVEKLLNLKEEGFSRLYAEDSVIRIDNVLTDQQSYLDKDLMLLVDRVSWKDDEDSLNRLSDSIDTAFSQGNGRITIVNTEIGISRNFSTLFEIDGILFEKPTEWMFNYNNPLGACKECGGLGKITGIDETLVIPDTTRSLYQEAIACWRGESVRSYYENMIKGAGKSGIPIHTPYCELSKEHKMLLWSGTEHFEGLNDFFKMVEKNTYKIQFKYAIARFSGKTNCPSCHGKRLRQEALYVKIGDYNIADLMEMTIGDLAAFFNSLILTDYERKIAKQALKEITQRLSYIENVGLSYLTLGRASNTLSGGESQRINLVSSLGNSLTGSMYILDEPSIGLHHRDTGNLIKVLKQLRDLGNSVIVVEHDEEIMRSSDQLIDIGPNAGIYGGEIVFQGDINDKKQTKNNDRSLTLKYLSGEINTTESHPKREARYFIEVIGARENNLKNISVKFPLNMLTVVTGVSGSGKSSLVCDILYPAINRKINQFGAKPGVHKELKGDLSKITAIEYVDQNPIGKSTRSNPATYLKIYDDIRRLYSEQPYAKMNGYGHSHFSFNIDGGRCPECQGEGKIKIDMQFMADVQITCESCEGKRFKDDILEVKYIGLNINDILNMSVQEAFDFFSRQKDASAKRIAEKIAPLQAVGLSYVKLGQSSSTLSGGENQRVKLASFLGKESGKDPVLFIFDEPTTGLHFDDIKKLISSFNQLIKKGHSVIVIEHNTQVIKQADWVIDLGPDAGLKGGEVVFTGTPEELSKRTDLFTGIALSDKTHI